jgi:hypothetical protein
VLPRNEGRFDKRSENPEQIRAAARNGPAAAALTGPE